MVTFDPAAYVQKLLAAHPSLTTAGVDLLDVDGCLVLRIYDDGSSELVIGEHDTGLDGDEYSEDAEELAEMLVHELNRRGVNTSLRDYPY